jgi:hypothetical protein
MKGKQYNNPYRRAYFACMFSYESLSPKKYLLNDEYRERNDTRPVLLFSSLSTISLSDIQKLIEKKFQA